MGLETRSSHLAYWSGEVRTGSKVRPALTEAQAQSLTDAQLDKLGYPARPDVAVAIGVEAR
jgi:hypothetical protein